nr:hypothetical protein [Tanacetum cinerariifolium]
SLRKPKEDLIVILASDTLIRKPKEDLIVILASDILIRVLVRKGSGVGGGNGVNGGGRNGGSVFVLRYLVFLLFWGIKMMDFGSV